MRLLVDGLNTLPEKEESKGVATYLVGAPVSLDQARFWILDPESAKVHAVQGFVTETGREGKLQKFTVVDAQKSLAARQQFTDQIGLITAAFYASGGGSRAIGTAAGEERVENLEELGGVKVGNLLGVVSIRNLAWHTGSAERVGGSRAIKPRPARISSRPLALATGTTLARKAWRSKGLRWSSGLSSRSTHPEKTGSAEGLVVRSSDASSDSATGRPRGGESPTWRIAGHLQGLANK